VDRSRLLDESKPLKLELTNFERLQRAGRWSRAGTAPAAPYGRSMVRAGRLRPLLALFAGGAPHQD
jgi:hypothetical protein